LLRDGVPGQVTCHRCQRVDLILVGTEPDKELRWTAGDHDLTIGRIVAGPGDVE
jgi:hypothetical protein